MWRLLSRRRWMRGKLSGSKRKRSGISDAHRPCFFDRYTLGVKCIDQFRTTRELLFLNGWNAFSVSQLYNYSNCADCRRRKISYEWISFDQVKRIMNLVSKFSGACSNVAFDSMTNKGGFSHSRIADCIENCQTRNNQALCYLPRPRRPAPSGSQTIID